MSVVKKITGRPRRVDRCVSDRPLGGIYDICYVCGMYPLHPAQWNAYLTRCGCSFVREGALLCRNCARAYDWGVVGSSKIKGGSYGGDGLKLVATVAVALARRRRELERD